MSHAKTTVDIRHARSRFVYESLKQSILSLEVAPQEILQEDRLAEFYEVSRTPVREAMRQLLDEGLIQRRGRFYQVTELTVEDIHDLYEVRTALECAAVHLYIKRGGTGADATAQLSNLLETQEAARLAGESTRFFMLDSAFHLRIAEHSGNRLLLRQLTALHDKLSLVRAREKMRDGWTERVVVEHRRILSALNRRHVAGADAEMRYHIDSAMRLHLGLAQQPI